MKWIIIDRPKKRNLLNKILVFYFYIICLKITNKRNGRPTKNKMIIGSQAWKKWKEWRIRAGHRPRCERHAFTISLGVPTHHP